jgi:hypothetical protein
MLRRRRTLAVDFRWFGGEIQEFSGRKEVISGVFWYVAGEF